VESKTHFSKAQGATEYLVTLAVVLTIVLVSIALLTWPIGTTKDAKQQQKDISLGLGKIMYPELAQGLVAYYKFDEGIGNVAYNSVAPNYIDASLSNTGWTNGVRGKAATFDGASSYGVVQHKINNNTFTVSAWVNRSSTTGERHITSSAGGFQFYFLNNNLVFKTATSSGTVPVNTWNQIAITYNEGTVLMYVNGAKVANGTGSVTTTNSFYIGAFDPTLVFFNGTIDDLHIYNRALSPQEIELLYKNPGYP